MIRDVNKKRENDFKIIIIFNMYMYDENDGILMKYLKNIVCIF